MSLLNLPNILLLPSKLALVLPHRPHNPVLPPLLGRHHLSKHRSSRAAALCRRFAHLQYPSITQSVTRFIAIILLHAHLPLKTINPLTHIIRNPHPRTSPIPPIKGPMPTHSKSSHPQKLARPTVQPACQ